MLLLLPTELLYSVILHFYWGACDSVASCLPPHPSHLQRRPKLCDKRSTSMWACQESTSRAAVSGEHRPFRVPNVIPFCWLPWLYVHKTFHALIQGDFQGLTCGCSVSLLHPELLTQHVQHLQPDLQHTERHQGAARIWSKMFLKQNGCPVLFSDFTSRGWGPF